jgi:hypothetical protein
MQPQALMKAIPVSSHCKSGWNLGQWKCELLSQWNWLYEPANSKLFHLEGSVWISWQPKGRPGLCSTSHIFLKGQRVPSLPTIVQGVLVKQLPQEHKVQVTRVATLRDNTAKDTQPRTFIERLQWFRSHNPKDAWILDKLELVGDHSNHKECQRWKGLCNQGWLVQRQE